MDSYKIEIRYHEAGRSFCVSGLIHVILTEKFIMDKSQIFLISSGQVGTRAL